MFKIGRSTQSGRLIVRAGGQVAMWDNGDCKERISILHCLQLPAFNVDQPRILVKATGGDETSARDATGTTEVDSPGYIVCNSQPATWKDCACLTKGPDTCVVVASRCDGSFATTQIPCWMSDGRRCAARCVLVLRKALWSSNVVAKLGGELRSDGNAHTPPFGTTDVLACRLLREHGA